MMEIVEEGCFPTIKGADRIFDVEDFVCCNGELVVKFDDPLEPFARLADGVSRRLVGFIYDDQFASFVRHLNDPTSDKIPLFVRSKKFGNIIPDNSVIVTKRGDVYVVTKETVG